MPLVLASSTRYIGRYAFTDSGVSSVSVIQQGRFVCSASASSGQPIDKKRQPSSTADAPYALSGSAGVDCSHALRSFDTLLLASCSLPPRDDRHSTLIEAASLACQAAPP